ncbi:MAG TPA: LiaF domain-containing protein [Symbiobacteriaceae bacterium]|nr:LiaF domain-containing protein [Symbiobacteriaceae bacterium]
MAKRLFVGSVAILAGLFLLARQFGLLTSQINIASLAIMLAGLWLFLVSLGRRRVFLALIGAWVGSFGGLRALHEMGYLVPSEAILFKLILPGFLVGIGLDLLFKPRRVRGKEYARGVLGDQRIGQEPWQLTGDMSIEHGVGDLKLDLSTAVMAPGEYEITVKHGMGDCVIIVPTDVSVAVEGRVKLGDLILFGEQRGGTGSHLKGGWTRPESPVLLKIKAKMGTGELRVLAAEPRRPGGWMGE